MQVPLLDLKQQYQPMKAEILKVTQEIYESQYFILGPHVAKLEEEIAAYCRTAHALGVSSGTDALIIALMAADVQSGDLVITSPYTFFATAGAIARVGATPVFADIEADTFNLSAQCVADTIAALPAEKRQNLKALIPVHLYGQCADMDNLLAIANDHQLTVIEDAAQAIGSEYKGRRAGSMGDYGCFSFFPSKNLGAFGDGGIVTVNDQALYGKLHILRVHGSEPKYYHKIIGGNFRLDALQAAIVSIKLKYLDQWTAGRQKNAATYGQLFKEAGLTDMIDLPVERENRHIYNQYVIMVPERRDDLIRYLAEAGIGCEVYYPVPLHLQECFNSLGYAQGDFPVSEKAAGHSLALPIFPELTDAQQQYVVEKIKTFLA